MPHPALSNMQPIATTHLKDYYADFTTHDTNHLKELDAQSEFVWCARTNGTHLFSRDFVTEAVILGWKNFSKCPESISTFDSTWSGWHYWNGYRLTKITTAKCTELVAKWEREAKHAAA